MRRVCVLRGTLVEKHNLENPVLNGWIKLKCFLKKKHGDIDWIYLVQGRDRWRILVNAVMNLRVA